MSVSASGRQLLSRFRLLLSERSQQNTEFAHLDALLNTLVSDPQRTVSDGELINKLKALKVCLQLRRFLGVETLLKFQYLDREIKSFISSLDLDKADDEILWKIISIFADWIDPNRPSGRRSTYTAGGDFPRTDQLGFIHCFVEYLEEVLENRAESISSLHPNIQELQQQLKWVISSFIKISNPRREGADLKDLLTSLTNLAYESEYIIDALFAAHIGIGYATWVLVRINQEICRYIQVVDTECGKSSWLAASISSLKPVDLEVIPLVENDNTFQVLFYTIQDPIVKSTFDVFPVPKSFMIQEGNEEKIVSLANMKSDKEKPPFVVLGGEIYIWRAGCIDEYQRKVGYLAFNRETANLGDKRYLVLILNVWNSQVLIDILTTLPDNKNGSRVVVVSPSPELALHIRRYAYKDLLIKTHSFQPSASPSIETNNKHVVKGDVVGFKDEEEEMLHRLLGGTRQLQIVSVFGMAGQGKTTLADKLFKHSSVAGYFHIRAWCCVSQVCQTRELLLELLAQVVVQNSDDSIHDKSDYDLLDMLYKALCGQRYLIIMDDMWDASSWDALRKCFPDNKNRSRIIFTTRIKELARQIRSDSILQSLNPLSDEESWELLKKKLSLKEGCPHELEAIGRKIAENCNGLPLAVVLASGLLSRMGKDKDEWKQVAETLSPKILADSETQCRGILELSYKHLPDHMKPCFLYLGAFLEDKVIPVKKIIRLWIAEGFINSTPLECLEANSVWKNLQDITQSKSMEDVAEGQLKELIQRSLVLVAEKKSSGVVKACRIHDLLRAFCLMKAKEEFFFNFIHGFYYGVDRNYSSSSRYIRYDIRRVCIYSKMNHFITLKPSGPRVRSLLFFAARDMCPSSPYDVSFISENFKLLKILDLEDVNIGNSLQAILRLVHLRYFAARSDMDYIPASIANLWNLETLLIKRVKGRFVKVPDSIWDLTKLRHVDIAESVYDFEPQRLEMACLLENLQTLSTPTLSFGDSMEKILTRLPCIRNLECIFLDSWDDARNCNRFPVLEHLSQLESLKVFYNGARNYPCEFSLPSDLKKLTLSNFGIPWNNFSQLAKLGNLEVLKLVSNAFEGETWEMMENEKFPKLRFLKLDGLDIVNWNVSTVPFPRLEHLALYRCKQLEEIPSVIGEIQTLQRIEVIWCNPAAATSAKKIQEEQSEYGNEDLDVYVHPILLDVE